MVQFNDFNFIFFEEVFNILELVGIRAVDLLFFLRLEVFLLVVFKSHPWLHLNCFRIFVVVFLAVTFVTCKFKITLFIRLSFRLEGLRF